VEDGAPLILTLRFDQASFDRLDCVRRRYFPAERNFIPAHLTLFHHLPGQRHALITDEIATRCRSQGPFPLRFSGLRFLGRGTAYVVESGQLMELRADLSALWSADLTRQDSQGFRPHVTIQNKVAPDKARALYEELTQDFESFSAAATGLLLWRYRGGPWEAAGEFGFAA
jgi:2'-5' RNA ligase